jgi:hypothetical protein
LIILYDFKNNDNTTKVFFMDNKGW